MSSGTTHQQAVDYEAIAALVRKVQAGDTEAFASIYSECYPAVYYACARYLGDKEEAAEVAQDVFGNAYASINSLKKPITFWRWINKIAYTACMQVLAKRKKERESMGERSHQEFDERLASVEGGASPEEALARKEEENILLEVMDELPRSQRDSLFLCYYEGFSPSEIADITQQSPGAIRKRLFDARRELKQKLELRGVTSMSAAPTVILASALEMQGHEVAEKIAARQGGSQREALKAQFFELLSSGKLEQGGVVAGGTVATASGIFSVKALVASIAAVTLLGAGAASLYLATAHPDATAGNTSETQTITSTADSGHYETVPASEDATSTLNSGGGSDSSGTVPLYALLHRPIITLANPRLSYPKGTAVPLDQILFDAGVSAHDRVGNDSTVQVRSDLYHEVDFTRPGRYIVAINAVDNQGIHAETALLVITVTR